MSDSPVEFFQAGMLCGTVDGEVVRLVAPGFGRSWIIERAPGDRYAVRGDVLSGRVSFKSPPLRAIAGGRQ
jgi:hypothetical protein